MDNVPPSARDDASVTPTIGVLRAPNGPIDITLATMESRIVRTELERRLGAVTLDLRTDGDAVGAWAPREHAAWPSGVDAVIDLGELGDLAPELVALFPRTVEPAAVDVRRRMLGHLGILPADDRPLTTDALDELLPRPARPTDLWLVVRACSELATGEPAHQRLQHEPDISMTRALDEWFDEAVAGLAAIDMTTTITRLRKEVAQVSERLAAAADDHVRAERTMLGRLDDLVAERDALRERLMRAELDRTPGGAA